MDSPLTVNKQFNESGYGSSHEISPNSDHLDPGKLSQERDCTPSKRGQDDGDDCSDETDSKKRRLTFEGDECKDDDEKKLFSKDWSAEGSKVLNIKIKLINDKVYSCQTSGKESILNMIKMKLEREKIKKSTKHMLFKSSKGYINLGLPSGVLTENAEVYECIYKSKLSYNTDDMVRKFDVEVYDDSWDIKYFYVRFNKNGKKAPSVSKLSKLAGVEVLQVPFLKGETFFEALCADKRFDQRKEDILTISTCQFVEDKSREIISLTDKASPDMIYEFYHSKADPIKACDKEPMRRPLHVQAPCPSNITHIEQTEAQRQVSIKQEQDDVHQDVMQEKVNPGTSSTRWSMEKKLKLIKDAFGLELQTKKATRAESKRKEKVDNFCCKKFSQDTKHHVLVTDMKDLMNNESSCVGAVLAVRHNSNKEPVHSVVGTCFRIGHNCIITNAHVLNDIEKHGYNWKDTEVSFNYTGFGGQTNHIDANAGCVREERLDYAILKLQGSEESLPLSVTDFGYSIALPGYTIEEPITLIGHPGCLGKSIDVSCPLNPPAPFPSSDHSLYIRQQHAAQYNVSTFFEGSSGSPGFLMHGKKVVVLHCQGFAKGTFFSFEEGFLLSSIVQDVKAKIESGEIQDHTLGDIFGEETERAFEQETPMDTESH